jgi:acetyl-CoA synthetase
MVAVMMPSYGSTSYRMRRLLSVAESGVIGAPDVLLYEKVVAFVHLHKPFTWSKELGVKIRLHVSNRASSIATPQEIVESVPKNKSGKIMRRVLKARYLGQDA